MFATNRPASVSSGFRLITPRYERDFNSAGALRIDAGNAHIVRPEDLRLRPETLKVLFRGSEADLALYDRVRQRDVVELGTYWTQLAEQHGAASFASGNGYQALRPSSPVGPDGQRGQDADGFKGWGHLDRNAEPTLELDARELPPFEGGRLHRRRSREIFSGPLLLVHKSPPAGLGRLKVSVSKDDVFYNESWYGFSAEGHANGHELTQYLALVLGSQVTLWMTLITSGEFGFEREVVEKSIIEGLVVPRFEDMDISNRGLAADLFKRLSAGEPTARAATEHWVASLYGLSARDLDVVRDTLVINLPFAANREKAQSPVADDEIRTFADVLQEELAQFGRRFGCSVSVAVGSAHTASPWRNLRVTTQAFGVPTQDADPIADAEFRALVLAADDLGATEVVIEEDDRHLSVGLLDQCRYWSRTQARLLAQRLIWTRPHVFRSESAL